MTALKHQLLKSGVGSVVVIFVNRLLLFVITMVLARICGAENYGVYAYVFAIVQILGIFAQMGFQVLAVREVATNIAEGSWGLLKGFLKRGNQIILLASTILVAGGLGLGALYENKLPSTGWQTLVWGFVLLPLIALGNYRGATLRGLHRIVLGQLPEFVIKPAIFLFLVLGTWLLKEQKPLTPEIVMALHAGAGFVAFAFGAMALKRHLPIELKNAISEFQTRRWTKSALTLSLVSGVQIVNSQTDIIMLGFLGEIKYVGVYKIAVMGGLLAAFGLQVVNMVIAPHFAVLLAEGKIKKLQRLAKVSARISFLFALIVAIMIHFLGESMLEIIFGKEFKIAYNSLRILAVGQVINTFMGSVVVLLGMARQESSLLRGMALTAILNIGLNWIFIPNWGMIGAAMATTITLVVWNTVLAVMVRRKLEVNSWAI